MPAVPGPLVGEFYEKQANDRFAAPLEAVESKLRDLLSFVNFGFVPNRQQNGGKKKGENEVDEFDEWRNGFRVKSDIDFFDPKAQSIFFHLMGELTMMGVKPKDLTAWPRRTPFQPQLLQNGNGLMLEQSQANGSSEKAGVMGALSKVASAPGAMLNFLSPPPLEEAHLVQPEEPHETVLDLYERGMTMVENFGARQATRCRNEVKIAVDKHVTKLVRELRGYTNGQIMDISSMMTIR